MLLLVCYVGSAGVYLEHCFVFVAWFGVFVAWFGVFVAWILLVSRLHSVGLWPGFYTI